MRQLKKSPLLVMLLGTAAGQALLTAPVAAQQATVAPGFLQVELPRVSPAAADEIMAARVPDSGVVSVLPGQADRAELRTAGGTAAQAPVSIAELARALKNDPNLIYEYVRNTIDYVPMYGIKKGGLGTLVDGAGTAADQADLMARLLRQAALSNGAIGPVRVVRGTLSLTQAQLRSLLGLAVVDDCTVTNYGLNILANGGVPVAAQFCNAPVDVSHFWVKATISGVDRVFDPALKTHVIKPAVDLAGITGYNQAAYLTSAKIGAIHNADFVQNINRTNVRANLTTYSNNLIGWLRNNRPSANIDDVLGGKVIAPVYGAAPVLTALPYQKAGSATVEYANDAALAPLRPTLRVRYQGIDRTFTSDQLTGHRLTIFSTATNIPQLALDGVVLQSGTATTPGASTTIQLTATEIYPCVTTSCAFVNQDIPQTLTGGGSFAISNGWGPAGRGSIDIHRRALQAAKAAGSTDTAEVVLGSSLAVLANSWIAQTDFSALVIDRLAKSTSLVHHRFGIAGQTTAPYVDLPGNVASIIAEDNSTATTAAVFYNETMHSSIFESSAVEEVTGASAVSTVKLIDLAVAGGQRIYSATSANYTGTVLPNLVGCASYTAGFQADVSAGRRLILPQRCDITENQWRGAGYFSVLNSGGSTSIGAIISGGLFGGFASTPQPPPVFNLNASNLFSAPPILQTNFPSLGGPLGGDPIDLFKGSHVYSHDDIVVGTGAFPAALGFQKLYSSGASLQKGPLGNGFTHNFVITANPAGDSFQGMGEDSPIDAATSIIEKMISIDLLRDAAKPIDKMVITTIGQRWFADQLLDNTVSVTNGQSSEVFVKLPNGGFNPPPASSAKLTLVGGLYRYETIDKTVMAFDAARNIVSWTATNGMKANFGYTSGRLTSVTNSLGRALTIAYGGNSLISSVSDGNGRSVNYTHDAAGNLITYADAMGRQATYQYDRPGRLTRLFYPANPANPFLINSYDSLGRIATQTNANGSLYNYYIAGARSEELAPNGDRKIYYNNDLGKVIRAIDGVGRVMVTDFDSQYRPIRMIMPEGNRIETAYDDATCGGAILRCSNNVLTTRRAAKPGSGLTDLVEDFTYEPLFNKIATSTDARGQVSNYSYDPASGNLLTISMPADAGGVRPQTSYAYTSFTAPVIGGSFSLVTAKTDRISATDTVVTGFTYNPANKFVAATTTVDSAGGGLNLTTTLTHDAIGNVTVVNGPRTDIADITSYSYDAERRRTIATDALGKQTRTFYDADGDVVRVASQFGAQWQVSCSTYSFTKKQLEAIGPAVVATDNLCPAAGPTVPTTTFTYDTLDRPSTTTQSLTAAQGGNRVTRTNYFSDGQVASLERAVGSPVAQTYASYTYTPNGLPATLVDAKAQRTTYGYDGFDRLARLVYPSKANGAVASPCSPSFVVGDDCELTSFDANGNVVSIRRRDGQSIGFVYDNLNRAITRIVPTAAETVSYSFDLLGRPLSMRYLAGSVVDKDYDVVSVWDRAGRLASTTSAKNRTLSFGYDPSGNRTQIIYPDLPALTVSYDYDVLNRVSAIRENGATTGAGVLASYVYDDLGRRTRVTLGNGAVVNAAYNPDDTLATLGHDLQGATATNDISLGYSYNQALQITGRTILPTLYAWKGHYNVARPYTVNGQNQYLTSGVKPIGHDARGNLTTDGTWTFTYDVDNRLRNADRTGQLASFAYDPAGRLRNQKVGTTATNFLYDGDNLLAEMNGTYLLLRRYVHGPGLDEPVAWYEGRTALTNKRWFLADHQGSIVAVTNSTGAPITRYAYGPFGEPSITTGSTFMYTGQRVVNKVGLYYYKARFYSPYLGRFLQTDPIGTEDDNNLYAYTANDPINLTDSSGNCPSCVGAASSVLLGGAIRFFTGQPVFDARAIGFDAAAGAVGAGLVSKAVQISRLGGLGLTATQKIGATSSLARAPTEGLYVLRSGGQAYVGQSGNTAARSAVSAAERGLTQAPVVRIGVEGGKLSREVAEQNALNLLGGKGAPGVLNSVNPIGVARQSALSNPTLGITSGVYAPGSSLSTSLGVGSGFGALNAFGSTPANAGTFGPK